MRRMREADLLTHARVHRLNAGPSLRISHDVRPRAASTGVHTVRDFRDDRPCSCG